MHAAQQLKKIDLFNNVHWKFYKYVYFNFNSNKFFFTIIEAKLKKIVQILFTWKAIFSKWLKITSIQCYQNKSESNNG